MSKINSAASWSIGSYTDSMQCAFGRVDVNKMARRGICETVNAGHIEAKIGNNFTFVPSEPINTSQTPSATLSTQGNFIWATTMSQTVSRKSKAHFKQCSLLSDFSPLEIIGFIGAAPPIGRNWLRNIRNERISEEEGQWRRTIGYGMFAASSPLDGRASRDFPIWAHPGSAVFPENRGGRPQSLTHLGVREGIQVEEIMHRSEYEKVVASTIKTRGFERIICCGMYARAMAFTPMSVSCTRRDRYTVIQTGSGTFIIRRHSQNKRLVAQAIRENVGKTGHNSKQLTPW
ncbi:hypothetical protein B0H19DRAFT_1071403 [Mycena capillaripes]|nr:hypothetical protein B0H19DRAFT_1071403 [Mycena capillaripes]